MKKILFLFGFLICSFGVFAANGMIQLDESEKMLDVSVLHEEKPELVIIIIDGEGYFGYDDGNEKCLTVIRVNGYTATTSQIGSGCP